MSLHLVRSCQLVLHHGLQFLIGGCGNFFGLRGWDHVNLGLVAFHRVVASVEGVEARLIPYLAGRFQYVFKGQVVRLLGLSPGSGILLDRLLPVSGLAIALYAVTSRYERDLLTHRLPRVQAVRGRLVTGPVITLCPDGGGFVGVNEGGNESGLLNQRVLGILVQFSDVLRPWYHALERLSISSKRTLVLLGYVSSGGHVRGKDHEEGPSLGSGLVGGRLTRP